MKQFIALAALVITAYAFPAHGSQTTCTKGKTVITVDKQGQTVISTPRICTLTNHSSSLSPARDMK